MAAPTPLPSGAPQTPSPSLPPLPIPLQGEEAGFCGLTSEQWRLVTIFVVIPLLLAFFVVLIVSWLNEKDISFLWLGAQERAKQVRTELRERLFGHLLSANDVRIITPGANITPRRYPLVDFLVPLLSRVRRGPGTP